MDFAAVARRFEAKHLDLTVALAEETVRFADECAAAFAGHGAYSNRVTGFGMTPDHVDRAAAFFDERGEDTRLEISSFAPPTLVEAIGARGFSLRSVTHVHAQAVREIARRPPPPGVVIERLDRADARAVRAAAVHDHCCFAPDREPCEIAISRTVIHMTMPTNDTFVARSRGEIVGVGCSESSHGVTLLFGGGVRPDHRGRGLQQALMNVRLAAAHERGSELACVMTGPGTPSERNARRAGFQIVGTHLYFARARRERDPS